MNALKYYFEIGLTKSLVKELRSDAERYTVIEHEEEEAKNNQKAVILR